MANSQSRGAALSRQMHDAYHDAARDIQSAMNDFYFRYADEQGITYDQARQVLSQPELRVWKKSLADYQLAITQAKTERTRMKLQAELDARAYASRIDRLDALNGQIEIITGRLAMEAEGKLHETMSEVYRDGYHKAWFELQQRIGYIFPVAGVNPRQIETVLAYPWSGNNFSGIIWQNRDLLTNQLRQTITQGLIQGRGINEMTNEVVNRMGVGFRQAHRVVITETAHFQNVADREVYREAGVEWLEFVATLDEATCPICGALDGTKIRLEDAVEGENVPVMHPNCACTTILHDPEEAQDWAAIGEPMPQRMTYEEWAKQNIPSDGEEETGATTNASLQANSNDWVGLGNRTTYKKADAIDRLNSAYGIRFSDSRGYPMNEAILSDCVGWLDAFAGEYPGFMANNPVQIPLLSIEPPTRARRYVGMYTYWPQRPGAVSIKLNGRYFSDIATMTTYIDHSKSINWTVANAGVSKTFVHEYGHHVSNSMRWITQDPRWQETFLQGCLADFRAADPSFTGNTPTSLKNYVSDYGGTNWSELFAETFAEYFGNSNPRGFAQIFGTKLDAALRSVK